MSAQSITCRRKAWIAVVVVLIGSALPWMTSSVSTRTGYSFRTNGIRNSQSFEASCSAWTTTFTLGPVAIPLGMTVTIGSLLGAVFAEHRGSADGRGKVSLIASIATIAIVLMFSLVISVTPRANAGIGVLVTFCGLVWQAVPWRPAVR